MLHGRANWPAAIVFNLAMDTDVPGHGHTCQAPSRSPTAAWVKALARAWRWQRTLDDGVYSSVSGIGDAISTSKSYVSRIVRLARLAPDIIEAIVTGRADRSLMLAKLERPLPARWDEQRQQFS